VSVRLEGLVWGPGADWEALVLNVTPISYAQCGLYAQFHRAEPDVYDNLGYLYQKRYRRQTACAQRSEQVSRAQTTN
jgi:hypothetical protein